MEYQKHIKTALDILWTDDKPMCMLNFVIILRFGNFRILPFCACICVLGWEAVLQTMWGNQSGLGVVNPIV